jgi:hypothetical protein
VCYEQAKRKSGAAKSRLLGSALQQAREAQKLKPGYFNAIVTWGAILLEQAEARPGAEASRLFRQAQKKLLAAETLVPGSGAYNLACMSAVLGDETACRQWLEKSRRSGQLPVLEFIRQDPDLKKYRKKRWLQKLLASLNSRSDPLE